MTQSPDTWVDSFAHHDTVVELLDKQAAAHGSKELCTFPQGSRSYQSLANRSRELAAGFTNLGVEAGDRVAIMSYNHPVFLDVYFAAARIGATVVPFNVSLRGEDLTYAVSDSDPSVVVLGPDCVERYTNIREDVTVDEELVIESPEAVEAPYSSIHHQYVNEEPPTVDVDSEDTLAMVYTSGTTGMPKGVELSHGSLLTVGTELAERVIKPDSKDRLYMSQPLFHIFAQMVMMEALIAGVPFSMEKWFSKSKFWDRVRDHDATIIHFSSAISDILFEETDAPDNPVRIAFGAIDEDIQADFGDRFNCQVVPLYGLTESSGLTTCGTVDEPMVGSIGKPTRYVDIEVVDDSDAPVAPGEEGELVIRPRTPNAVFSGYYNKPERTVEVLSNQWLHTGDIGYKDTEGRFHFVSRKSYFLRRKGENVSVYEVERVLNEHSEIEKSIVIGVDAEVGGEEILAAIKLSKGATIDPLDIIKFCEEKMAYFKIPRYIAFVDEFPRTETKGTIERHKIQSQVGDDVWDVQETDYKLER